MQGHDWKPHKDPWHPADWGPGPLVSYAIQAWRAGTATPEQQKLAFAWVMYLTASLPEYQDLSFRPGPDGERATTFAEGKRFVGMQILKMGAEAVGAALEKEALREADRERRQRREERRTDDGA